MQGRPAVGDHYPHSAERTETIIKRLNLQMRSTMKHLLQSAERASREIGYREIVVENIHGNMISGKLCCTFQCKLNMLLHRMP